MGNYKNSDVLDIIISGISTVQGNVVTGAMVTGKYAEVITPLALSSGVNTSLSINATMAGRVYSKYNTAFDDKSYYV
jgi:hypothetical protein